MKNWFKKMFEELFGEEEDLFAKIFREKFGDLELYPFPLKVATRNAAVKQNGYVLQHVKRKTREVCLAAFLNNVGALDYISNSMFDSF